MIPVKIIFDTLRHALPVSVFDELLGVLLIWKVGPFPCALIFHPLMTVYLDLKHTTFIQSKNMVGPSTK